MLGWKIFSVEYRLAPEHPFLVPLEDCDKSMDWLIENADQFEIDINKIAVGGDSAGGNLAACLCIKRIEEGKIQPERQSEEHTSELQSHSDLVCRLLLEKKNINLVFHLLLKPTKIQPQYRNMYKKDNDNT